jgi:transcriptional regulator with XRE-family HTH domain
MAKTQRTGLAERMRSSARDAGLTAEAVARQLDISASAVWAWWSGRNEPSTKLLAAYAALVKRSIAWLITGAEEWSDVERLVQIVGEVADRFAAGADLPDALESALDRPGAASKDRADLIEDQDDFRSALDSLAGGDWRLLTSEQRQRVLEKIKEIVTEIKREGGTE